MLNLKTKNKPKMKAKTETLEGYIIEFKKFALSKNIKISLREENKVLVTMPLYCPIKKAREFLLLNFEKIKSFNSNFKKEKKYLEKTLKTKFETLKIEEGEKLETKTKKNIVYFSYPKEQDFYSKEIQEALKSAYLKAIKIEAQYYLKERIEYLAQKYDFKFQKLTLRNQKTRFGSCSYFNNINLNINLMRYDFDCIDYVIIHELCHTRVKNHSSKFWEEVEKYCPDYKKTRAKLKSVTFSF